MFNTEVLVSLGGDVGEDVLEHLLVLFEAELRQQSSQLYSNSDPLMVDEILEILHILKNTSRLYGVEMLQERVDVLYERAQFTQEDIAELRSIIDKTVAHVPLIKESL
ncbi:hypothetical protein [Alteromonas hispanica]|uniref:HPt domain-containing protein n=1 Tax=Alteromonas hispanica TaxID=315421 RepID=A0A6L9MRG9_9ALTE|nr:hypothetical protein [Alteromonas hispanica]NDW20505.1 hypothetical protein [Alteromonas hispanica]